MFRAESVQPHVAAQAGLGCGVGEQEQSILQRIEHCTDFIGVLDLEGRFTYLSRDGRRLIGLDHDAELGDLRLDDVIAPGFREAAQKIVAPAIEAEGSWEGRMQFIHLRTGAAIDVWRSSFPLRGPDGRMTGYACIAKDITAKEITDRQQPRAEFSESKARFRGTFDQAAVGMAQVALDGRWLRVNQRLCEMLGYTASELLQHHFHDVTHPEDVSVDTPGLKRLLSGEIATFSREKRYLRKDGTPVWINLTVSVLKDEDGVPQNLISVIEDISLRKSVEATLRAFYEVSPLHMGTIELLDDGDILHLYDNPATNRFFGVPPTGMQGRRASELGAPRESIANWRQHFKEAGARNAPVSFEHTHRGPGGPRHLAATVSPLGVAGPSGRPTFCYVAEDVTERRALEAQFRAMADNISQLAWMADETGWIYWYNQRWFDYTGTTLEEMQGWGWRRVHHPDHVDRVVESLQHAWQTGEAWEETFPLRSKSGEYRWFLSSARPIRDAEGRVVRWFGTNTDITAQRETEAALRKTERRFKLALAGSPVAILEQDLDLRYTWVYNPKIETAPEVIGKTAADVVDPKYVGAIEALKRSVLESGRAVRQEIEVATKGAPPQYSDLYVEPRRSPSGKIIGLVSVSTDITERKLAEMAQHEIEARYRTLFANMAEQVHYWKVFRDDSGQITHRVLIDANPAALKAWDKTLDDIRGKTPDEIFAPGMGEHYRPVVERIMTEGVPYTFEGYFPNRNLYLRLTSVPLGDHFITTGADVTTQKLAEYALRDLNGTLERRVAQRTAELEAISAERARLASVAENSPDFIGICDIDFRGVYLNPAAKGLVGITNDEEVQQHPPLDYFAEDERGRVESEILPALGERGSWVGEINFRHFGTNERIPVLFGAFRIDDPITGMPSHYATVTRDLRERKHVEAQLVHAQKMDAMGQITGGIAHDFNNLLTAISGNLELIEEAAGDNPARVRRLAASALRAAQRGARLNASLLAFSRKQPLRPEVADANALVREFDVMLRRAVGDAITMELALRRGALPCRVDAPQLEAALLNLAINARDAMPKGGSLKIATHLAKLDADDLAGNADAVPGSFVAIEVADTGHGMQPDVLEKVFEPFFTTKDVGKGSGLGLSQVYGFARQLGGHVSIASEPECGTTVTVYLPAAVAAPEAAHADAAAPRTVRRLNATVLVVEDDLDVRETNCSLLKRIGCRVLDVGDGPEALAVIEQNDTLDLLLTDVVMPNGMNGVELAREARRRRPGLKVLLTSGYAGAELERQASEGGYALLAKPYRPGDLIAQISATLSAR